MYGYWERSQALIVLLLVTAYIYWQRRALWYWITGFVFPGTLTLSPASRVLVIAPHCDDETLGAGGAIHLAAQMGCKIKVVLMTNGDGSRSGAAGQFRRLRPRASEYITYAYRRQGETLKAMARLGLNGDSVIFLGYPDRGLAVLWAKYWGQDRLYRSAFTGQIFSPYRNAYTQAAPHCGVQVADDLKEIVMDFRPSHVFVPHALDLHPDHWATHAFAMYAFRSLAREGRFIPPTLYAYLIHRGKWPLPRGFFPRVTLTPPKPLAGSEPGWTSLALPEEAILAKRAAVLCYRSQIRFMRKYLLSFVRRNEIFVPVPLLPETTGQFENDPVLPPVTAPEVTAGKEAI